MSERTTQEIQSHAQAALSGSPIYDLRTLRVESDHENGLLISGTVASFYHKQLAQELVRAIAADAIVVNLIHVADGYTRESLESPHDRLKKARAAGDPPIRIQRTPTPK
jgi:hypothetical protein